MKYLFLFLALLPSISFSNKPSVEVFLVRTYQYEGGSKFTDTKFDGHFTKYGIIESTLKHYYSLTQKGDSDQNQRIDWNDVRLLTWDIAVDIYKSLYWNPAMGDSFKRQKDANLTVDYFVNSGFRKDFILQIQKISKSKQDGIIGIKTITAINKTKECYYFNSVLVWRKGYYQRIVKANPQRLGKLLNGLNNRLIKICKNENNKNSEDFSVNCNCLAILQDDRRKRSKTIDSK